ncbi:peptidase domain-containing ABC transporter [Reichenbachiella versicolor]|uniref:peptidase domain-containing ABC transporter n=1 Tax=Reichenbachiella versicolor TaxID=1821036 RepID=UPI000D6E9829|nr:ATP-binding cassette domain-containing protein [Reichenbachiella versicolor]
MRSDHIVQIIKESAAILQHEDFTVTNIQPTPRHYEVVDRAEFKRDLIEAANGQGIVYLENTLGYDEFVSFLCESHIPIVAFEENEDQLTPLIFYNVKRKNMMLRIRENSSEVVEISRENLPKIHVEDGIVIFLGVFAYKSLVSNDEEKTPLTPFQRLIRLLSEEKKDIIYIYFYAVLVGLISLSLPVGIQATVGLISGGVFFSSVYVLIGLVIVGVLAAGGLQITQITLVEYLQRRVFTKAAFEFAFRIPRIKSEALLKYYAPELMNRFFDVLTIQKGLPKLLIDLSAGVIQILFGLMLLSFYHPFFVFFSLFLVGLLTSIFYATGPKGLSSSIKESKFKYRVVYWLEELARTINSFKLSGNTPLPMRKTDFMVNNYLKNRKIHFRILLSQYSFVLLFKTLVTGGLLIIGTMLVVQREITLGQFVAAEVIIILTLSSVEKIIMYMDVVYDMLTAVDKISLVTDLPLEKSGGLDIPPSHIGKGFAVHMKGLKYKFPGKSNYALNNIDLKIEKRERVCIAGRGGSGRRVLTSTISGFNNHFEGLLTINNYSLRDLDLMSLRDLIGKNVSQDDIFEGTILENIILSKPNAIPEDALWALEKVGILDAINAMPDGLNTTMMSSGKGLSRDLINKIILARCLSKRPELLILNDFFNDFLRSERRELMNMLADPDNPWTLVVVSNDRLIMDKCDRVIIMEKGTIKTEGTYQELLEQGELDALIN